MIKLLNKNNIYKKLIILGIAIYVISIFVSQQKDLNSYKNSKEYYALQIKEQEEYKEELIAIKSNVDSPEYIEQVAREKLDMYLPNEKVYIDMGK